MASFGGSTVHVFSETQRHDTHPPKPGAVGWALGWVLGVMGKEKLQMK